jgi:threonine dehydrogenase-like Zn-dependent dehydrogenase
MTSFLNSLTYQQYVDCRLFETVISLAVFVFGAGAIGLFTWLESFSKQRTQRKIDRALAEMDGSEF